MKAHDNDLRHLEDQSTDERVPPTLGSMQSPAAAPQLLEALKAASDWIDAQLFVQRTAIQEQIRQALDLANGKLD